MKAFHVAVVLSLISVCQPAPLTCEQLLAPVEKGPDLSGRWHYIALSTELCLATSLLNAFIWPSIAVDVTPKDKPNLHDALFIVKMYGYCFNDSEPFLLDNNKIFDLDSDNVQTGVPDVLLYTSCPDCIVVKANDVINTLVLLSRRKTITDVELKEFETQTECLRWSKPLVLNSDHEYDNCKTIDDDISEDEAENVMKNVFYKMYERVKSTHQSVTKCLVDMFLQYVPVTLN